MLSGSRDSLSKAGIIDFASRFPPRQLEARGFGAKILELGIGTMKIESGACDLPPEGSKEKSYDQFAKEGWNN